MITTESFHKHLAYILYLWLTRDELRWLAQKWNVKRGRDKADTAANLITDDNFRKEFKHELKFKLGDIYLNLLQRCK